MSRALLVLVLIASPVLAHADPRCAISDAVRGEIDAIQPAPDDALLSTREKDGYAQKLAQLAAAHRDDVALAEMLADARAEAAQGSKAREALLATYKQQADADPRSALAAYLYADMLGDLDRTGVEATYESALKLDPELALAHLRIAQRADAKKREAAIPHLRAYLAACPNEPAGHALALTMLPPAERKAEQAALRTILDKSTDPHTLVWYWSLWSGLFEGTTRAQQPALRKLVAADVARLGALPQPRRALLATIHEGAELAGDKALAKSTNDQLIDRFPHSMSCAAALYKLCKLDEPRPGSHSPIEVLRAYQRKLYAASDAWVKQWPTSPIPWNARLRAASELPEVSNADVLALVDRVLGFGVDDVTDPRQTVARIELDRGVRLDQSAKLLDEVIAKSDGEVPIAPPSTDEQRRMQDYSVLERFDLAVMRVRLAAAMHDRARAETAYATADKLGTTPLDDSMAAEKVEVATSLREAKAWLLASQGRALDAIASALAVRGQVHGTRDRMRLDDDVERWWKAQGGTADTLAALLKGSAVVAEESAHWRTPKQTLPKWKLQDLDGKTWSLEQLKGKVVFASVWATWCGPCQQELPKVQALADKLRGKKSAVLLTLNVDDNVGVIAPFVAEHAMKMPVLLADHFFTDNATERAIPQTWIFDGNGVLRRELVGYEPDAPFVEDALKAIGEVGKTKK
jgi:thiol-disulfide isomerase/thioredoxin